MNWIPAVYGYPDRRFALMILYSQVTRKENSITTIIKFALLIVANCLVILLGILSICLWIDVDSHNEKWSHPGFISYKANLTLNQDITVVNSGKPDESITLKKDTMIICENISERGVLYSEDHDSVHYHEYIPFDYFVESEELKETSDSRQNKIKAIEQVATIKKICFSAVYLAIAFPVTIILFMKKKYRATLVINFILMFVALFISWFVYLLFHLHE